MKPSEYYKGREQTYLKHFFLERYLETVAFHIGWAHQELIYVDCFSGPWRSADEDLADTSIRIALDKLNYVRDGLARHKRHAKIKAIFVEKDQSAYGSLEAALQQHRHAIQTVALLGAFEENIPTILKHVGDAFAFFFIDPTGWAGFAMDRNRPILCHQPGEIMVNFIYDFINRFINYPEPANEQSLDKFFGTRDWRGIREAMDREEASVELYGNQLQKAGGYTYVTSTRILKPLYDRAYFHLIYGTRNPKGILEFRKVEKQTVKEQDEVWAAAQQMYRETKTGQAEFAFGLSQDLSQAIQAERVDRLKQAQARLFEILKQGPVPFERLQPMILETPLVWKSDLDSMLMNLRQAQRIVIDGLTPRQRVPRAGNFIRPWPPNAE
jgi:three-Cys-motif partner protein